MTARQQLDTQFVEAEPADLAPANTASTSSSRAQAASADPSGDPVEQPAAQQEEDKVVTQEPAKPTEEAPAEEPAMIGSCDRLWARIIMKPKPKPKDDARKEPTKADTKTASAARATSETTTEIRKAWMWGNVALHKDAAKKKKENGSSEKDEQDATGEAIYLDNLGPNKAVTFIYQRDPNEKYYLPGPLPPARVKNGERELAAAGIIQVNQATDQAWVSGPGTFTQMAARGLVADKGSSEPGTKASADKPGEGENVSRAQTSGSGVKSRNTTTRTMAPAPAAAVAENDRSDGANAPADKTADSKPSTRAGRPTTEKVPMAIGFSERMDFSGRSIDPEGKPAGRANFYGIVTAQMEDALLHCTEKMIAFTDREIPLTQLGKMTKGQSQTRSDDETASDEAESKKSQAELTIVQCFRNAIAISRKVDPLAPTIVQQQRIEADEFLEYDRRTGDFYVPGKGKVYLYERNKKTTPGEAKPDGADSDDAPGTRSPKLTATQRTVHTTSGPASTSGSGSGSNTSSSSRSRKPHDQKAQTKNTKKRDKASATRDSKEKEELPLVLIQVLFNKEMRGRFGANGENDDTEHRWCEFFGDVQAARANVKTTSSADRLNFDRLPLDGVFLTGQTLRVLEEQPPVGSPESTPSQYQMKAWEKAYASSNDKIIQGDVITYDSYKDLVYAYGENGHSVNFAEQHSAGLDISPGAARAVQLNPKTGNINIIDAETIQLLDKNTGYRPSAAKPIDPYDIKKKKPKKPFKLPTMNVERRGFTGQ